MALMWKLVRELNPGDRVVTEYGVATVRKVIHDGPRVPEMQIAFEGAIGQVARLDYMPTEAITIIQE